MDDFQLTPADKASGLWLRLVQHFEARLLVARTRNDSPALDLAATAALRGEIAALKRLIALGADAPIWIRSE